MDDNIQKCGSRQVAAGLLALGVFLGGFFPGYFYYRAKMDSNFDDSQRIVGNGCPGGLGRLGAEICRNGNDLKTAQNEMNSQLGMILGFLKNMGFQQSEITTGRIETNDLMANPYRSGDAGNVRYILTQGVQVRSNNVDNVARALNSTAVLISKGVVFDSQTYGSPVSYLFTKLNEIKPKMLEEATKNAQAAAAEFAKSSNSSVGRIRSANQGVFSILPRDQTATAQEINQIEKKVRVVATVQYFLE